MGVDPLIQRLDQMTTSISQLLQLARVGQSFSAGSYQQVLLLDDVVNPAGRTGGYAGAASAAAADGYRKQAVVSGDDVNPRDPAQSGGECSPLQPEGSTIRVSVKAGLMPVMAVEDEGPGIDEAKAANSVKPSCAWTVATAAWPRTEHRHAHRSAA